MFKIEIGVDLIHIQFREMLKAGLINIVAINENMFEGFKKGCIRRIII